jgi:hypothetical protein
MRDLAIEWERIHAPMAPAGAETFRHLTHPVVAIVSRDSVRNGPPRWHMSVSHRDRIPTWGELGMARDALLPADLHFMVPHPPRRYWLNYDRRVLHLWEMRDPELAEQFEWEGAQAQAEGMGTPDTGEQP